MSPETEQPGTFRWPPIEVVEKHAPDEQPQSTDANPLSSLIESIEIDLLGRVGLSFDRWAQRTGWRPDSREACCWRCAGSVGPHEQDGEGCAACRSTKLPWDRAFRLSTYRDEIRDEVLALKFHAWRPGGRALGTMLGRLINEQVGHAQIPIQDIRIVPIPMHPIRRIRRGIDHTLVIARGAGASSSIPVTRVLRARHRPEQVGRSPTARAKNMKDAFRPRHELLRHLHRRRQDQVRLWVLIDDVRTTGATFSAASKALRAGLKSIGRRSDEAEIWVCSIGVTQSRDRRGDV